MTCHVSTGQPIGRLWLVVSDRTNRNHFRAIYLVNLMHHLLTQTSGTDSFVVLITNLLFFLRMTHRIRIIHFGSTHRDSL